MSTQSTQVTPQVAAPEQATATPEQGDNAVGTVGWAMNLARTAGNNHMMGILGGLTGGPVGSALGWMLDLGASRLPASSPTATAATPEAAPAAAPQLKVRVTASKLNVRSSPDSASSSNLLGQLAQGNEIAVVGTQGDWILIEYNGQPAYISARHTTPVQAAGTGTPNTTDVTPPAVTDTPVAGATDAATGTPAAAEADTGGAVAAGSATAAQRILSLANDFNAIPVWAPGVAGDQAPTTTFRTPYVLNTVDQADEAGTIKAQRIAEGRPNAGQTVSQAAGNNAFLGKGTPQQMQIIAQACVDNGLATTATIQNYVNMGRMRNNTSRNGKFGVDCSGFTGIAMNELEGDGRVGNTSHNAAAYKHDGSRDFTPVSPDDAVAGDVISYEYTNHVVVVYQTQDVNIPMVGATGEGGATRRAVKLSVAESTGSQNATNNQYVRTDRGFWYFPNATQVFGQANPAGPEWLLAGAVGAEQPKFQSALGAANYSGNNAWTGGFTLNCANDPAGTNLRTRGADGRFTSTSNVVANGAANVEFKEVSGDMVRVRVNGQDTLNGLETWAPLRYVATQGTGYTIPTNGQPRGMSAKKYSVVRNPDLPAAQQPAAEQPTTGPQ